MPPNSLVGEVREIVPRPGRATHVTGLRLDMMDDEEMLAYGVAVIEHGDRVWIDGQAKPMTGGLLDLRMAAIERTLACETCCGMADTCPGHAGVMPLARAVFTPATLPIALLVLRTHCHACGQLLVWGAKRAAALARAQRAAPNGRLRALRALDDAMAADVAVCRPPPGETAAAPAGTWCGVVQPAYELVTGSRRSNAAGQRWHPLRAKWPGTDAGMVPWLAAAGLTARTIAITAERAALILRRAIPSLTDAVFAGDAAACERWTRALTPRVLSVVPPPARPTDGMDRAVTARSGANVRLNALTTRYQHVWRASDAIASKLMRAMGLGKVPMQEGCRIWTVAALERLRVLRDGNAWESSMYEDTVIEEEYACLQLAVDELLDAKTAAAPPRGGSRFSMGAKGRSLATDLSGKTGMMREAIQGKRGNFTARTVVTPDPCLPMGTLAVPGHVADTLTLPITVTDLNAADLTACASCELTADACLRLGNSTRSLFSPGAAGQVQRDLNIRPWDRLREGDIDVGWTVEVTLRQAIVVLGRTVYGMFNRQPSLHRPSMMAMRLIVTPGDVRKTFAFNEKQTRPFNADYDGDEMNLFVPQTDQGQAEAATLMAVQWQLPLPQTGGACMDLIQDTRTAAYVCSGRETLLTRDAAMDIAMAGMVRFATPAHEELPTTMPMPAIVKSPDGPRWTGKQLLGLALPRDLSIDRFADASNAALASCLNADDDDNEDAKKLRRQGQELRGRLMGDRALIIRSGEILTGRLDERAVGAGSSSLVARIEADDVAMGREHRWMHVVDRLSAICVQFFMHQGFSMGLGDIMLRPAETDRVRDIVDTIDAHVDSLVFQHRLREAGAAAAAVEATSSSSMQPAVRAEERVDVLEACIQAAQEQYSNKAGEAILAMMRRQPELRQSAALVMNAAGSKGKHLNIRQMAGCVGGQLIGGKRVVNVCVAAGTSFLPAAQRLSGLPTAEQPWPILPLTRRLMMPGNRTMPHFVARHPRVEDGGFVRESLLDGLRPIGFFFHAMGSREGLIDTAVKTAETGYAQRRIIKSNEDLSVAYDGTVRNCANRIVQFAYGLDAARAARIDAGWIAGPDCATFTASYTWPDSTPATADEAAAITQAAAVARAVLLADGGWDAYQAPVNIAAVLEACAGVDERLHARLREMWDDGHADVPDHRRWLVRYEAACRDAAQTPMTADNVALCVAEWLAVRAEQHRRGRRFNAPYEAELRARLGSKHVLLTWHLTMEQLTAALDVLASAEHRAQATPGDAVGVLAGQSMGEPATQRTLNTFHVAGTAAAVVGGGVRFNELIVAKAADKQRGPSITLTPSTGDGAAALALVKTLQSVTFSDVLLGYELGFAPIEAAVTKTAIAPDGGTLHTVTWRERQVAADWPFANATERDIAADYWDTLPVHEILGGCAPQTPQSTRPEKGKKKRKVSGDNDRGVRGAQPPVRWSVPELADPPCALACRQETGRAEARDPAAAAVCVPPCLGSFVLVLALDAAWFEAAGLNGSLHRVAAYTQTVVLHDAAVVWMSPDTNAAAAMDIAELPVAQQRRAVHMHVRLRRCIGGGGGDDDEVGALRAMVPVILNAHLAGIDENGRNVALEEAETLTLAPMKRVRRTVVRTNGLNLAEALALDGVSHIDTNEITEVQALFGIEAACQLLRREYDVMVQSGSCIVAAQHTRLLADNMCHTGRMLPFSRDGIKHMHGDFLLQASFEQAAKVLQTAALSGNVVQSDGQTRRLAPATAIMFGRMPEAIGTSAFTLHIDMDGLAAMVPTYGGLPGGGVLPLDTLDAEDESDRKADGGDALAGDVAMSPPRQCTFSPAHEPAYSPVAVRGAVYSPSSPSYAPTSPTYSPTTSPTYVASATSPAYSPTSPSFASPTYSPTLSSSSPAYSAYSPTSPAYSFSSPTYASSSSSPAYSFSSPVYSPTAAAMQPDKTGVFVNM